jgi:hypothetical protein
VNTRRLPSFRVGELSHTQVTDVGIDFLKECRELRMLSLQGTRVSEEGVNILGEARPQLQIVGP